MLCRQTKIRRQSFGNFAHEFRRIQVTIKIAVSPPERMVVVVWVKMNQGAIHSRRPVTGKKRAKPALATVESSRFLLRVPSTVTLYGEHEQLVPETHSARTTQAGFNFPTFLLHRAKSACGFFQRRSEETNSRQGFAALWIPQFARQERAREGSMSTRSEVKR